jgi:hypothetical protein
MCAWKLTPILTAALLLASASYPADAQMGMGRGGPMKGGMMDNADCPMMGMMMNGQEQRLDQRLDGLKKQLGITTAQDAAWTAYAAAVKKNAEGMQGAHQTMRQGMTAKTPVERLDGHIAAMDGRANLMKALKPALMNLYESLTADQKAKANSALAGRGCMF